MSFHFVLKKQFYDAIKSGEKTSEWRDGSEFWISRLLNAGGRQQLQWAYEVRERNPHTVKPFFLLPFNDYHWKHKQARFVVGYTKRPMLTADVTEILFNSKSNQFEIRIENVVEIIK